MPAKHTTIGTLVRKSSDIALGTVGYARSTITVLLKDIGVHRLRLSTGPARLHIRVFVDGKPQFRTELSQDALSFVWRFTTPVKLLAHASSVIKFCIYREHSVLSQYLEDHVVGQFEGRLAAFLNCATQYRIDSKNSPSSTMQVTLEVDYGATLQDPSLVFALHQVERLWDNRALHTRANSANPHLSTLGQAIQHIDKVMDFVENMVELHAFCKVAWVMLMSIYNAVKTQVELDADLRLLVEELRDSLALICESRGAAKMPGASATIQAVIHLVIEAAGLVDEWIYMKTLKKAFKAATFDRRIRDCTNKLSSLRTLMTVLVGADHIVRTLMDGMNEAVGQIRHELRNNTDEPRHEARSSAYEVQHLLQKLQPFALEQPANDSPTPSFEKKREAAVIELSPQIPPEDIPSRPPSSECPPVGVAPSQSSQDSRASQDSQATQSTALPPYTAEQLPPFSDDTPVTVIFDGPMSDEPQDVVDLSPRPEQVQPFAIAPDTEVSLVFDDLTFEEPISLPVPSTHLAPTPPLSIPDDAEVLLMFDLPVPQATCHDIDEHHASPGAKTVSASEKKREISSLPSKRQWWKHARHPVHV